MQIKYYNNKFCENISSIDEVVDSNDDAQLARLHNRISPMQPETEEMCINNHNINKVKILKK